MLKVNTLPFTQLRNAEHVSFLTNVKVAIERSSAIGDGLTPEQFNSFKTAVDLEQDIVNRSLASIYTPEMKATDVERDRLYRLIRLKLQACLYASPGSLQAELASRIERDLLSKYGADVCSMAYQEESAVIAGFILDVKNYLDPEATEAIGIDAALLELETANTCFVNQYNERVVDKTFTESEVTKKLRGDSEEQYRLLVLALEYKANGDTSKLATMTCGRLVSTINGIIKDARHRLNVRLGKVADDGSHDIVSPVH